MLMTTMPRRQPRLNHRTRNVAGRERSIIGRKLIERPRSVLPLLPFRAIGRAVIWLSFLLATACGSGAVTPPTGTTVTTSPTGAATPTSTINPTPSESPRPSPTRKPSPTRTGSEKDEYSWGLPVGDVTVTLNEDVLYRIVQRGACKEAQSYLDGSWNTLQSPRTVLLYQAGVDLCAGRREPARRFFEQAERTYGWAGVDYPYLDCNVYQRAASVLRQRAPTDFPCLGGPKPPWPPGPLGAPRDDPRTPVDESA